MVDEDFISTCLEYLNNVAPLDSFNHTHIILMPKCKDSCSPNDFRPISLYNVSYKVISNVLANRLTVL